MPPTREHARPVEGSTREPTSEAVADRLLSTGLVLAATAFAVQALVHLLNFVLFDLELEELSAGSEEGVFTWASTVATFAAAFALLVHAASGPSWRRDLLLLAGILAFFSFDDVLQVHERIGDAVEELGIPDEWELRRIIWPAVFFPLLAAAFVLLLRLSRASPARERRFIRGGMALLVAAIALEAISTVQFRLGWEKRTWPFEIEIVLEEGAELAGWIVIAAAVTAITVRALAALPRR